MHHPSGIPEKIVRKVVARRGRLHAFESVEARRTALVALSGHAHGLHEATLATFYRIFGDVRPSSEIVDLL
jgi:hypothetical protein